MSKLELTVVIPAVIPLEETLAYKGFLESPARERLFVQFVHLRNLPKIKPEDHIPSEIRDYPTHQVLAVTNDRYYSSCEENMFRVQDFVDLLKPYVFFVGDHDLVDWEVVAEGIQFAHDQRIDAMGWKIVSQQKLPNGGFSTLDTIPSIDDSRPANRYCQMMLAGNTLPSNIGYAAMVSFYGPIDWVAYIGSHVFSKAVFGKIMQYNFSEYIYAMIYKMAAFFTTCPVRYGYFNKAVVYRVGEEFVKVGSTDHTGGWLGEHRAVHGQSPLPWIPNLHYMEQLKDDALFDVMVNGRCVACEFHPNGEQRYQDYHMLHHPFWWSERALNHRINGRSFYFPEASLSSGNQDVRYIQLFFAKILRRLDEVPEIYEGLWPKDVPLLIEDAVMLLTEFLETQTDNRLLLGLAGGKLQNARTALQSQHFPVANTAAFNRWLRRCSA